MDYIDLIIRFPSKLLRFIVGVIAFSVVDCQLIKLVMIEILYCEINY